MKAPPLKLVVPPAPGTTPVSFDASRPAPHTDALRTAWWAGHQQGYRTAYMKGWRLGVFNGVCATICLAILMVGIAIGLGLA